MAYTLTDIVTELRLKAKDTALDQTLLTMFVNDAQQLVLGQQLYSFMEKSVDTVLAINQYVIPYPADHQSSFDLILIDPTNPLRVLKMKYLPYEVFYETFPNPVTNTIGMPLYWTDYGHQIFISNPLDMAYIFRHRYLRVPTTLVNTTDVPDIPQEYRQAIVNYAMGSIEEYRDNFAFASSYQTKGENLAEDMVIRWSSRQLGEPSVIQNTMGRSTNVYSK